MNNNVKIYLNEIKNSKFKVSLVSYNNVKWFNYCDRFSEILLKRKKFFKY